MDNTRKRVLILIVACCLTSCHHCAKTLLTGWNDRIPAKRFDSYDFNAHSTLVSRIKPAPAFLLDYLRSLDRNDAYVPYALTEKETAMVGDYLETLPVLHKNVLQDRLIGIFFIEHFPGAGMTDYVPDRDGRLYIIMVFNPEIFGHTISQWMTYRENSAYRKDDDSIAIEVDCGSSYSGFMYGLLHESSHAIDYVLNYTPYTEYEIKVLKEGRVPRTTPFVENAWLDHRKLAPGYDLPRDRVSLYGYMNGPRLSLHDALPLYHELSGSPFASLCSLMNWAEDFAEYVTWYHFTTRLGQPYTINLRENGVTVFSLSPMESEKVKKRAKTIQSIYAIPEIHPEKKKPRHIQASKAY